MKQKWTALLALVLCAALLLPSVVMAGEVTPDFFLEMAEDAQKDYLEQTGLTYEEAAGLTGGNNKEPWKPESTDTSALLEQGYVQCIDCAGWYMNGNEFRNHFCTANPANPSSSWTSKEDYYDALVEGDLNSDTVIAIGELYVNTANGKSLNLRARPSTDGEILTSLPNGTSVTLFWYEDSAWAYVAYRSYYGFCMIRHLSEQPGSTAAAAPAPSAADTDPSKMYDHFKMVNYSVSVKPSNPTGFVNMRWAPSKAADVQCIYYANTVLRVLATNGTWSQVYDTQTNQCGFMMNAYLNKLLN